MLKAPLQHVYRNARWKSTTLHEEHNRLSTWALSHSVHSNQNKLFWKLNTCRWMVFNSTIYIRVSYKSDIVLIWLKGQR